MWEQSGAECAMERWCARPSLVGLCVEVGQLVGLCGVAAGLVHLWACGLELSPCLSFNDMVDLWSDLLSCHGEAGLVLFSLALLSSSQHCWAVCSCGTGSGMSSSHPLSSSSIVLPSFLFMFLFVLC